jgi:broad specificity phosphatase PhoE
MSLLLLVRHGQASWGQADYDRLSEAGVRQSKTLGTDLAARGIEPALVVRGSMRRHRETAETAVAGAGWACEVVEDPDWDEFDHLTTLSGSRLFEHLYDEPDDERVRRFNATIDRWASGHHDDEYAESFPAFRARVEAAAARVVERLGPGGTAVVFTSGGPVSWTTAQLIGGGVAVWPALSKVVVNTSVTKVLIGSRGTSLVSFNDHSHLEPTPDLITYR